MSNDKFLRHDIYSRFLEMLSISDKHRADLEKRGLSRGAITQQAYRSLGYSKDDQLNIALELYNEFEDNLFQVPGFFKEYNRDQGWIPNFTASNGIIFPSFTKDYFINSLYIRRDGGEIKNKYIAFSCEKKNKVPLDSKAHWTHVGSQKNLYLTEGGLKANVASHLMQEKFCALPGVAMWKLFQKDLIREEFNNIYLANDRDIESNIHVLIATIQTFRFLLQDGFKPQITIWDDKFKGIDDALLAGSKINHISTKQSKKYLEKLSQKLGLREVDWSGRTNQIEKPHEERAWLSLRDLPKSSVILPDFDSELLPSPFCGYISDSATRMQVPLEFIAGPLLVVTASVIGRKLTIKPKKHDNWKVTPNLYGAIVGRPSLMKTPAITTAKTFLQKISNELDARYEEDMKVWRVELYQIEAQRKSLNDKLKKNYSSEKINFNKIHELKEELLKVEEQESLAPIRKRLYYNDATIEKLQVMLKENPNGLLCFRDELMGLIKTMDKHGHEGDREFYLEAWNGDCNYYSDRIARGTTKVEGSCLSILGGIQPSVLQKHLVQSAQDGQNDDGFIQRFQILFYPDIKLDWVLHDKKPDEAELKRVDKIIRKIYALDSKEDSIHFDSDAQNLFFEWLRDLETRLRSGVIEPSALESHLGKYRSLLPSLALIFEVVESVDKHGTFPEVVSLESLKKGIQWCRVLECHANKIYNDFSNISLKSAHLLLTKIREGTILSGMTIREIYRNQWSLLTNKAEVLDALSVLEMYGWAKAVFHENKNGRKSQKIEINPKAIDLTDITDIRDESVLSVDEGA